ncbi:hypothetical protein CVT26_006597 [Gymnopilus dilepis]|uniref:Uncharacterized protein n=1 Tax=Gymnopilus dilepis TaxID=231916 RepID=A0A409Y313_9AGAR|nr:hypothetical protein CVT26_006597 [Gymnopilus dilepis]
MAIPRRCTGENNKERLGEEEERGRTQNNDEDENGTDRSESHRDVVAATRAASGFLVASVARAVDPNLSARPCVALPKEIDELASCAQQRNPRKCA